ncbi:MAG: DUF805 domain-containing protein [Akkermansia sp.]|nr:DUF805 domain-containing protein [Akkermansia sp.]
MGTIWQHFANAFRRENYARMAGRATLAEYWSCMLFALLFGCIPLGIIVAGCVACLVSQAVGVVMLAAGSLALLFYVFYTALPMLAVYVRRLHDVGWSGWWIAVQYGIVAVMAVLEIGIFLQFQIEFALDTTQIPFMTIGELFALAQDFQAFQPAWFKLCCAIADPALSLLTLLLFVLTLLPGAADNKYGRKPGIGA